MLNELLKKSTSKEHEELEGIMLTKKIFEESFNLSDYKQVLLTNYEIHRLIEENISNALDIEIQSRLNIKNRRKLPALIKDLEEAQIEPDKKNENHIIIPQFKTNSEALGAMYVLEGAMLGGNVILKQLRKMDVFKNLSLTYYSLYGAGLRENWISFIHELNTSVSDEEACLHKAKEVFHLYAQVAQRNIYSTLK